MDCLVEAPSPRDKAVVLCFNVTLPDKYLGCCIETIISQVAAADVSHPELLLNIQLENTQPPSHPFRVLTHSLFAYMFAWSGVGILPTFNWNFCFNGNQLLSVCSPESERIWNLGLSESKDPGRSTHPTPLLYDFPLHCFQQVLILESTSYHIFHKNLCILNQITH